MKVLIGIDPDVDKSGFATLLGSTLNVYNYSFTELLETILVLNKLHDIYVVIEAGWLNKSNWHMNKNNNQLVSCKKGYGVGRNHQVGILIAEFCEYHKISYEVIRPTQSKVKSYYFNKMTGYKGRTNQEQRDAAMLIWGMKHE